MFSRSHTQKELDKHFLLDSIRNTPSLRDYGTPQLHLRYCRISSCTLVMLTLHNAYFHNCFATIRPVLDCYGYPFQSECPFLAATYEPRETMRNSYHGYILADVSSWKLEVPLPAYVQVCRCTDYDPTTDTPSPALASTEFRHARARSVIKGGKL